MFPTRLDAARQELAAEAEFDHTVTNVSIEQAAAELVELLSSPALAAKLASRA